MPTSGSRNGGTKILISGKHFGQTVGNIRVTVGESDCKVVNVTSTLIECVTSPVNTKVEKNPLKAGIFINSFIHSFIHLLKEGHFCLFIPDNSIYHKTKFLNVSLHYVDLSVQSLQLHHCNGALTKFLNLQNWNTSVL